VTVAFNLDVGALTPAQVRLEYQLGGLESCGSVDAGTGEKHYYNTIVTVGFNLDVGALTPAQVRLEYQLGGLESCGIVGGGTGTDNDYCYELQYLQELLQQ
jgi:hypothetical protein